MQYYWSCFSHNQALNEVLREAVTQVTLLVSWPKMAFFRAGGAETHWPYQASYLPGETELSIQNPNGLCYVQRISMKRHSSPNLFFQL